MSDLKPSVYQALFIGDGCGLTMLGEAIANYMNHSDCFFLIEKYAEQYEDFCKELKEKDLLDENNELIEITIKQALKRFEESG